MAYIFLSVLFLRMDLRIHLCFLKAKTFCQPRLFADPDAAVIRKRCCHDVVGITPVPEQSDPHLYLRRYRRDRTRICHRVCDGTAFQGPLLGLQQPAIQCSRVYLPHLIHRLGLSDDLYDACDPQTDRACRPCDTAHVEPVFRVLRDRDLYL